MSRLALLLLFLHLFPSPQSRELAPHELFDKVSDLYGRMDSLSADFEQIQKDANRTYTLRGHVYLKKGRRARFDYVSRNQQVEQIDYFDGKTHTRYEPPQKQAREQSMGRSEDERLLIFLILGNRESPWKNEFGKKELGRDKPRMSGNNKVLNLTGTSKCIRAASFTNGALAQLWDCNSYDAQQVWNRTGSAFHIVSGGVNYCLENLSNMADGADMGIYSCTPTAPNLPYDCVLEG